MVSSTPPSPSIAPSSPLQSGASCDRTSRSSPRPTLAHSPTAPSLVSFSFSQLFSYHDAPHADEDPVAWKNNAVTSPTTVSTREVALCAATSNTPSSSGPTFSFEDCVRFKLCLTCALCGRLLRHQPAVIETCGHCFCYDCVNTAVEDGCVPLVQQWPWSRLSGEVEAAAARWAAATAAKREEESVQEPRTAVTTSDTKSPGRSGGNEEDDVVVTAVTPTRAGPPSPFAAANAVEAPPSRPRKLRKVRQKCPLCLGPAFKWMLVTVPSVAELCTQLSVAYPALEEVLSQLADSSDGSCSVGVAVHNSSPSNAQRKGAEEDNKEQHEQPSSTHSAPDAVVDLVTAAFTPSVASSTVRQSGGGARHGHDSSSQEDEEAVRRRRRNCGGPRKEITFADEVRASLEETHSRPIVRLPLQYPVLVTDELCEPQAATNAPPHRSAGFAPPAVEENGERKDESSSTPALPGSSGSLSSRSSITAAALQLSVDLIPSPDMNAVMSSTTGRQLTRGNGQTTPPPSSPQHEQEQLVTNMCHAFIILGQSPSTDQQDEGEAIANHAPPHPYAKPTTSSQVPYLSETLESVDNGGTGVIGVPHATGLKATGREEENVVLDFMTDQPGCVLLDTTPLADEFISRFITHLPEKQKDSAASGYTFLCDRASVNAGQATTQARVSQRTPPYSCVRASSESCYAHILDTLVDNEPRDPSDWSGSSVTVASVHPHDVWQLETAHVQRHPHIPNCFSALRVGHLVWLEHDNKEESATTGHLSTAPPLRCVAGSYPAASSENQDVHDSDSFAARRISSLSPAVCTAAVFAVPCIDIGWFSVRGNAPWKMYVATSEKESSGTTANHSVVSSSAKPSLFWNPSCGRKPGAWMADTRHILLTSGLRRQAQTAPATANSPAPDASSRTGPSAFYFFLLPDGAVLQLARIFYRSWSSARHVASKHADEHREEDQGLPQHEHLNTSRKRRRDSDAQSEAWDTTDGHPQRAWRRLLLVLGGAVVEMSASLFAAVAAASVESEEKERTTKDVADAKNSVPPSKRRQDDAAAAVASHAKLSEQNVSMSNWIHVDIDEGSPSTECATAATKDAQLAQHTLFLLYSPAVVRKACDCVSGDKALSRDAFNVPKQTNTGGLCFNFAFQIFLTRIAALVASVLTPTLPAALQTVPTVAHEVRPARWLLENVAEGRRSAGSSKSRKAQPQAEETRPQKIIASGEANSVQPQSQLSSSTPQTPAVVDGTGRATVVSSLVAPLTSTVLPSDESPGPPQRVGVYRSLLYSDTP
ncbi:RING finger protein conserved [Leptomonas pyrrhocoris]|uniref:RING finger protein conserved n=1 Tax=Leptomonas pyrrhocoris TaxID=157538 RepID=A0A0M9GA32_LEPPY|nr:RING finger protein conserved [Leptomonas pyrrhocoris]KPA85933.1 RING finger protein conserved [Leptomonas pyrrhocoris]|eukprot:XP_015664372.1 RING finger protein conserved [Leptomonas pyrrhocoris]